jgi:hypothetical protein
MEESEHMAEDEDRIDIDPEMMEEGWTRVENVSKHPRASFSVRLSREEFEAFNGAAKQCNQTLADFLRSAAWAAVQGASNPEKAAAAATIREKVQELAEAARKL